MMTMILVMFGGHSALVAIAASAALGTVALTAIEGLHARALRLALRARCGAVFGSGRCNLCGGEIDTETPEHEDCLEADVMERLRALPRVAGAPRRVKG
jgi:hypothetical protein